LTDILYSYILDKHIGMTNIKKKVTVCGKGSAVTSIYLIW